VARLRQAPGVVAELTLFEHPECFYSCESKLTLWVLSPCSIAVGPKGSGIWYVDCGSLADVPTFLPQASLLPYNKASASFSCLLHRNTKYVWSGKCSLCVLRGIQVDLFFLTCLFLAFWWWWFVGVWNGFPRLSFPPFWWLWSDCALGNYL